MPSPMVTTQRIGQSAGKEPKLFLDTIHQKKKKSMVLPQRPHGGRGIHWNSLKIQSVLFRKVEVWEKFSITFILKMTRIPSTLGHSFE